MYLQSCVSPLRNSVRTRLLAHWQRTTFPRSYASRTEVCAEHEDPKCAKERLNKLPPCPAKKRRMESKEILPERNSMWENPECCTDPCPDYAPRFDELYYKSSNKLQRKYQQTWIACPQLQIKPKVICNFEQLQLPAMEKRSRKERPKTACPQGILKMCLDSNSKKCPQMKLANCQGVRKPPKCKRQRSPTNCKKECTPYPSYSECMREDPTAPHPVECKCLNHPMMCDVWSELRRRMTFVK